jgi:hypothetical protein
MKRESKQPYRDIGLVTRWNKVQRRYVVDGDQRFVVRIRLRDTHVSSEWIIDCADGSGALESLDRLEGAMYEIEEKQLRREWVRL